MSSRAQERKAAFKKGIDATDARRKRADSSDQLRKVKREDNLLKKRREALTSSADPVEPEMAFDLQKSVAAIMSDNVLEQLEGCTKIRRVLSIEKDPPIDKVIAFGVVPRFVQFLGFHSSPKLQFEAAWALTNIASGNSHQTQVVVESGAINHFVALLSSPDDEVKDQAIWALGNIAGDGHQFRDLLIQHNAIGAILPLINNGTKVEMLRNATWCLSNLCRGKPAPKLDFLRPMLPYIAGLLTFEDTETLTDACWAASYISDGSNDRIQAVIDANMVSTLVSRLAHPSSQVHTPALRAVGNIVTGDELHTQAVLDCNPLPRLLALLRSTRKGIRKEAAWAVSNITAGSRAQIKAVIDAGLIPDLLIMLSEGEFDVKREACWAVSNLTSGGSRDHISYLVAAGVIKPLVDLLRTSDIKMLEVALEAIENILRCGDEIAKKASGVNQFAIQVEEAEGIDNIELLQRHENIGIYNKAVAVLDKYFAVADEDENAAPNVNANGQFNFSGPSSAIKPTFSF